MILVQRKAVADTDERMTELRKTLSLDTKSLVLLMMEGDGEGAKLDEAGTKKAEKLLLEHAVAYYKVDGREGRGGEKERGGDSLRGETGEIER